MASRPRNTSRDETPSDGPPGDPPAPRKDAASPDRSLCTILIAIAVAVLIVIAVILLIMLLRCGCFAAPPPPPGASGGPATASGPPVAAVPAPTAATATIQFAWTQLVPDKPDCVAETCEVRVLFRAIVPQGASCEGLARAAKDNTPLALRKRENRKPDRFPVDVCEGLLTLEQQGVNLANESTIRWSALAAGPRTISIIGDTGCDDDSGQNCNAVPEWPLAKVASDASWVKRRDDRKPAQPDLVIHVGDYRYRGDDNWTNWRVDFFEPVRMLMLAAPWVTVRGNHENCYKESGPGWAYFMAPSFGHVPPCDDSAKYNRAAVEPTSVIDLKGLRLVAIDAADARYRCQSWSETFRMQELDRLNKLLAPPAAASEPRALWLLTHYPVINAFPTQPCPNTKDNHGSTAAYMGLLARDIMRRVDAIVSGDIHSLQLFHAERPDAGAGAPRIVQFVAGNSGTHLDQPGGILPSLPNACPTYAANPNFSCTEIELGPDQGYAGAPFKATGYLRYQYGHMTAQKLDGANKWLFRSHTLPDGKNEISCEIPSTDAAACAPEAN